MICKALKNTPADPTSGSALAPSTEERKKGHRPQEYSVSCLHFRLLWALSKSPLPLQRHGHVVGVPHSSTSVTHPCTTGSTGSIHGHLRREESPAYVCCMSCSSISEQGAGAPSQHLRQELVGPLWRIPMPWQDFVSGCHYIGESSEEGGWWRDMAFSLITTSLMSSSWCPRQVKLQKVLLPKHAPG